MSKIIVPLEPQSSPLAYIESMLDIDERFTNSLAAKTIIRTVNGDAEMIVSLLPGVCPHNMAMHLKLGGIPHRIE